MSPFNIKRGANIVVRMKSYNQHGWSAWGTSAQRISLLTRPKQMTKPNLRMQGTRISVSWRRDSMDKYEVQWTEMTGTNYKMLTTIPTRNSIIVT